MPKKKIFLFGLDRAGKTVITNYLLNKTTSEEYRPTTSFSIKNWDVHKIRFHMWDAPGQENFRKIWIRGIQLAHILIFILDASDNNRFEEAKNELSNILHEIPENNAPIFFCYHKMDLSLSQEKLLNAQSLFKEIDLIDHEIFYFETSILKPVSLDEVETKVIEYGLERGWDN